MKRIIILILTILLALIAFGCISDDSTSTNDNTRLLQDEEILDYKVDKILLSKSFQTTEPFVEVTSKKDTTRVLASLGLTESSGVKVNKLVKKGNEVNIHVSGIYEETDLQLAVPQVTLEIKVPRLSKLEDLNFNIVNDNYKPLKIKIGINEVLSKIQSHFKVSPSGSPVVNLTRLNDSILWKISYDSIFDRDNPQTPLINLSTSVDANSGDIIEFKKTFISSSIDDGHVLDYTPNNYLLYKKSIKNTGDEEDKEQLWSYNLSTKEKNMIFSSNLKIVSAKYSKDLSYVSLIESSDKGNELYIIPREDKKAYKISFEDIFSPKIMSWQDDNTLFLVENSEEKSIILSHEVKDNIINRVAVVNKKIENLIIQDDIFLIVEDYDNSYNLKLSTTFDWKEFNFIDYGFNPNFIGKDKLGYIQKAKNVDNNSLYLYSLTDEKNINIIDKNISTFQTISDNTITYVKNNPNYNNFTLTKYSLDEKDSTDLAFLVDDKVYYDIERDNIYVNITLPFENDNPEIIFSIDLSKLD